MTNVFAHAKSIVGKLVRAGYIAYFAGGWVRDYVMGHPSEDIDIATSASPSEVMDLFPHTILVGLAFGVVIVVIEGHQFEVATFRRDLPYLDGRHPQGIEMSSPREDALRRDFTINGMFYDPLEEKIHDYVHGQEDIHLGIIRTIGYPQERFLEDRLRMLRAFRFAARFSFHIDLETQEAIRENANSLFPAVAMERVWQEFNKMAAYPRFDQALMDMHRLRLLEVIFPEIKGMHLNDLRYKTQRFSHFPQGCPTILYLMEILNDLPYETKIDIAKRLKVSNKDLKLLEFMENLTLAVEQDERSQPLELHQWAKLFANPDWELGIKIIETRQQHPEKEILWTMYVNQFQKLGPHIERLRIGKPIVSADLLQIHGIKPGKKMGLLLKEAERLAINENWHDPTPILEKLSTLSLWKDEI